MGYRGILRNSAVGDESIRRACGAIAGSMSFIEGELRRPTSSQEVVRNHGRRPRGVRTLGERSFDIVGVTVAELVSKCDAVRRSANWHYNANDSKPKKGNSDNRSCSRGQKTRCDLPWSFTCALWPLHCWSCCSAAAEVPPAPPLTLRLEARPRWLCRHLSATWRHRPGWKFPTTAADACLSSRRADVAASPRIA